MYLTHRDYKNFLEILYITYTIHDRHTLLSAVYEKLEKWIGTSGAVFLYTNPLTGNFELENCFMRGGTKKTPHDYLDHYTGIDPLTEWLINNKNLNKAAQNTDFVSCSQLENSEFYQDFLSQIPIFYCLGGMLGSQGIPIGGFGLHRRKRDKKFNDREKNIFNIFLPHLANALHNQVIMETIASVHETGVIVIGIKNKLLFINEVAKQILNGRPVTSIPDPGLSPLSVYFKSGDEIYRVLTKHTRLGKREKVIFLEPIPGKTLLQSKLAIYHLSERQEEIAIMLMQGFSNRKIAERLFISELTVKDHLQNIFEKTGVHTRSELIAKVLNLNVEEAK